ncbi:MAG: hypothetical protein IPO97_07835 [Sphingomonadales bacterium]|nr:hypothetical protein [Sphingomonadales bacterium]
MRGGKIGLGALFVGIGPVKNLLFDKLACSQRLEWCAGQIEIGPRPDRQEFRFRLQRLLQIGGLGIEPLDFLFGSGRKQGLFASNGVLFALKQFLGTIPPRAKMIFVENHQVPVYRVNPLVLELDVAQGIAA